MDQLHCPVCGAAYGMGGITGHFCYTYSTAAHVEGIKKVYDLQSKAQQWICNNQVLTESPLIAAYQAGYRQAQEDLTKEHP